MAATRSTQSRTAKPKARVAPSPMPEFLAPKHEQASPFPEYSGPKGAIIQATIIAMATSGIDGLGVRQIAAAAGVNIAAINYHFGSKEKLIEIVLRATGEEAFVKAIPELEQAIQTAGGDIPKALVPYLVTLYRNAMLYPGISAAHFDGVIKRQDYSGTITVTREFYENFFRVIQPGFGCLAEAVARRRTALLLMSLNLLGLAPQLFDELLTEPLSGSAELEALVRDLVDGCFR